jgi:hypothetical protein
MSLPQSAELWLPYADLVLQAWFRPRIIPNSILSVGLKNFPTAPTRSWFFVFEEVCVLTVLPKRALGFLVNVYSLSLTIRK